MASKSKGMDGITCLCILSGLIFGAIISFCLNGSEVTANATLIDESPAELPGSVLKSVNDGIIILAVKFLHFLISKWLQFRFVSVFNHSASFFKSALFWVALTRSVSSSSMQEQLLA
ncbi:hypothetical protein CRG98_006513 [Punica granatum]|nr:hypothetical protein CRG98_006513 [Punica granatum]